MRPPDRIIGPTDDPYMYRWYVWPRNRFFNLYLHKFLCSDDDRALHDHPWWFVSIILRGAYSEVIDNDRVIRRSSPSIAFRRAEHRHRVVLDKELILASEYPFRLENRFLPVWTLVFTGARVREWGFWCPKGFVHWKDFTSGPKGETIGKGCEE